MVKTFLPSAVEVALTARLEHSVMLFLLEDQAMPIETCGHKHMPDGGDAFPVNRRNDQTECE